MATPNVTVLIANYNYGDYLHNAIQSALHQDAECRIMVVDDCSTDGSRDVIETFGDKIESIYLTENVGPSATRNHGIRATMKNTDFYQILDSDDVMKSNKVSTLLQYATMSPRIGVVYADFHTYNPDLDLMVHEYKEAFSIPLLRKRCIVHSGALVSKAVFMECGLYDEGMRTVEDCDLWFRTCQKFQIIHVAEPLTLVHITERSSTNAVPLEEWEKNWDLIRERYVI